MSTPGFVRRKSDENKGASAVQCSARGRCKTVHLNSCKPQFWHGDYLTDPDPLALNFTLHPRKLDIHKTHLVQSHKVNFPTTSWGSQSQFLTISFLPRCYTAVLIWWYDNDRGPVAMTLRVRLTRLQTHALHFRHHHHITGEYPRPRESRRLDCEPW